MFSFPKLSSVASWRKALSSAPKASVELSVIESTSSECTLVTRPTKTTTARMRPPNVQSAMEEVLAMPELLEAILLHLPMGEILLTAQLVSSSFYDTIADSALLQQALFFAPAAVDRQYISRPNPLVHHHADAHFIDERDKRFTTHTYDTKWPSDDSMRQLDWKEWTQRFRKYTVRGASWRRMLVVQPPVHELNFPSWKVSNAEGVRMGQLENAAMGSGWRTFHITCDGRGTLDKAK
ncbi:hypothetical protein B0O99DRAFT_588547 [Bisporella sp. PMI_857]|nr:hypothetical protein B0O99DRAFT_588547 [Bisporella sp. PMI_857]